jgi:hypothetical protein
VTLDETDDLEVDADELFSRLLDDVAFNGGTKVLKTLDMPGLGGIVVGALSELVDRLNVDVKVLVDIRDVELDDDEDADGLDSVDEGVTPALLETE